MPRTKVGVPPEQLIIEEELRKRYGGMMSAAAVGRELGLNRAPGYTRWLDGLPYNEVNGRKKWTVRVVAQKIYETRVEPYDY